MILHQDALKKLHAALSLARKPVGVKFFYEKAAYEAYEAKQPSNKLPYCVMVKLASKGTTLKSTLQQHGCGGATRALGLEAPPANFLSGEEYMGFGLYETVSVAKTVAAHITLCSRRAYGIVTGPLEQFTQPCDVVLLITNAYAAMRLVQGYTYRYGTQAAYKMNGNQAICSECTAYPFETNAINLSMLCSGTRYLAGWQEDELGVGVPYEKFIGLCEGVYASINGTEQNKRKLEIQAAIDAQGLTPIHIGMDEAYYIRETKTSPAHRGNSAHAQTK